MDTILEQIFTPQFPKMGLRQATPAQNMKRCGMTYVPDASVGKGSYWIYPVKDLFAITIMDLVFRQDVAFSYEHPEFLTLGNYSPSMASLLQSGAYMKRENLVGYFRDTDYCRVESPKSTEIRCVSVTFLPKFYKEHLRNRFEADLQSLPALLSSLTGEYILPDVSLAFSQLHMADPSAASASMYFEGKVLEIISKVMDWQTNRRDFPDTQSIADVDMDLVRRVGAFLKKNCDRQITIERLGQIFYTNKNKLSYLFMLVYGVSIIEFVQTQRMERAKELLVDTDMSMKEIAALVGYKNQGSFSDVFKHFMGLTPSKYRINST